MPGPADCMPEGPNRGWLTLRRGRCRLRRGLGMQEVQCSLALLGLTLGVCSAHLLGTPTLPAGHLPPLLIQLLLPGFGGRRLFDGGCPSLFFLGTRILPDGRWGTSRETQALVSTVYARTREPSVGCRGHGATGRALTIGVSAGTAALFSGTLVGVVVLLLFSRCCRRRAASCSSWKASVSRVCRRASSTRAPPAAPGARPVQARLVSAQVRKWRCRGAGEHVQARTPPVLSETRQPSNHGWYRTLVLGWEEPPWPFLPSCWQHASPNQGGPVRQRAFSSGRRHHGKGKHGASQHVKTQVPLNTVGRTREPRRSELAISEGASPAWTLVTKKQSSCPDSH